MTLVPAPNINLPTLKARVTNTHMCNSMFSLATMHYGIGLSTTGYMAVSG